jgi:hypothetical protein
MPAGGRCGDEVADVLYQPFGQEADPFKNAPPGEGSQAACGTNKPGTATEERRLTAGSPSRPDTDRELYG